MGHAHTPPRDVRSAEIEAWWRRVEADDEYDVMTGGEEGRMRMCLDFPVVEELETTFGVDAAAAATLRHAGITTSHALLGHALLLRTAGAMTADAHESALVVWLQDDVRVGDSCEAIARGLVARLETWIEYSDESALALTSMPVLPPLAPEVGKVRAGSGDGVG